MRSRILIGMLVVFGAGPAGAQGYSLQEQEACTGDAFRFCQNFIPDIPRITACLEARRAELSPACQRMFDPERDRRSDTPGRPMSLPRGQ